MLNRLEYWDDVLRLEGCMIIFVLAFKSSSIYDGSKSFFVEKLHKKLAIELKLY